MNKAPKEITLAKLDVLVMPNGEILCAGKTIGWVTSEPELGERLSDFKNGITGQPIAKENV